MTENSIFPEGQDFRKEAESYISKLFSSRKINGLQEYFGMKNLSVLSFEINYSIITVLLYNILKNSAGVQEIDSYVLNFELYHIAVNNIIKSCYSDKKHQINNMQGSGYLNKADYLLLSDGLLSHISKQEYLHIFSRLPASLFRNALESRQYAQKKIIDLRSIEMNHEKRVILSFMLVKLILYLSCLNTLAKEQIDMFAEHFSSMDIDNDSVVHNELYEQIIALGLIK